MSKEASNERRLVRIRRIIPASPEEVFNAWIDARSLKQWMAPGATTVHKVELDVRVGGRFCIVMKEETGESVHTGEYREIKPPERLVFTWRTSETLGQETIVTVLLRPWEGQTELTLIHEQLPTLDAAKRHEGGWKSIVSKLKLHLLETPKEG